MTIVDARFEHVPDLRRLFAALLAEQHRTHPQEYPTLDGEEVDQFTRLLARRLGEDPDFLGWVALTEGGTAVGFLAGEITSRAIGKPHRFAAPHWLYVMPEARGYGVARALVLTGVAWLHEHGIADVELAALAGDDQWARRGWQPYLVRYQMPTAAIAAVLTRPPAPAPTPAAEEPAPAPRRAARTVRRRRKAATMNGRAPTAAPEP